MTTKYFFALAIVLFTATNAYTVNLTTAKFPFHYECHNEATAGLYNDKSTGSIESTVFTVDKSDKWQMTVFPIDRASELANLPLNCTTDRNKFNGEPNRAVQNREFCMVEKFVDGTKSLESATHCRLLGKKDGHLLCGPTNSFYFDTDRLLGIKVSNDLTAFVLGLVKAVDASRIACQRLDR